MKDNEKKKQKDIAAIIKILQDAPPEKVSELLLFIESYLRQ